LTGANVARGDQVGSIWSGAGYNRKPTGMVCVGDTMYLAVQDLALDFNDVPAATILKSVHHGRTWTWDQRKPMFGDHVFTTIWFADFGKGGAAAPDGYVYAYGLDGNWRDSFDDTVADPQRVFLARVPKRQVQDRKAWELFAGSNDRGKPEWSRKVADRQPVLTDQRRLYQQKYGTNASNLSVISQGGTTYLPQQKRYVYTSWTEYTFEFYESPTPWGPWKHFLSKDFGGYPWSTSKYGGYGVTIPSKFVQPDGRTMYLQANVCPCGGGGIGTSVYNFNLRKLVLTPSAPGAAVDLPGSANLAAPGSGAVAVSKSSKSGKPAWLFEGTAANGVDRGLGFAHSGANNGWIRTSGTGFSALNQKVPVQPGATYTFGSWINASAGLPAGEGKFGVRGLGETTFGASTGYVHHEVTVKVPAGVHEVTVYAGFDAPGADTFIQVDDFTVGQG
jgi:hypothetical protein